MKPNIEPKDKPRGHQDLCKRVVRAYKRSQRAKVRKMLADYKLVEKSC